MSGINETYRAKFLTYGKVVSADPEHATKTGGSRVTSYSGGYSQKSRLAFTPDNLMRPHQLNKGDIGGSAENSLLVIRESYGKEDGYLARIAFPPENPNDTSSRRFLMMRAAVVEGTEWRSNAPSILAGGLEALNAIPDDAATIRDKGESRDPLEFPLASPGTGDRFTLIKVLNAIALMASHGRCSVGTGDFSTETEFLKFLAVLMNFLPPAENQTDALVIAAGLARSGAYDLEYIPEGTCDDTLGNKLSTQFSGAMLDYLTKGNVADEFATRMSEYRFRTKLDQGLEANRSRFREVLNQLLGFTTVATQQKKPEPATLNVTKTKPQHPPEASDMNVAAEEPPELEQVTQIGSENRFAETFRDQTNIPILEQIARLSRELDDFPNAHTRQRATGPVPSPRDILSAGSPLIRGEQPEQKPHVEPESHYRINLTREGLNDLESKLKDRDRRFNWKNTTEQFWIDHKTLFVDEYDAVNNIPKIRQILLENRFNTELVVRHEEATLRFLRLHDDDRLTWSVEGAEILLHRLGRGICLPSHRSIAEVVRLLWTADSHNGRHMLEALWREAEQARPREGCGENERLKFLNTVYYLRNEISNLGKTAQSREPWEGSLGASQN